jgi:catechol 2,3-dioxygenase-like lactoylglutathione lyase family enzyme
MVAIIRYIAFISEKPDELAKFYNRFLGTRELGRSAEGDISISDGFYNLTFFKRRPNLHGGTDRSLPGVRHIAYNTHDPEGLRQFYSEVLGLREVHSSYTYRRDGKLNRFVGDSCTNLALHPFYNSASPGHEMKFGINHIGFLVRDLKATMDDLRSAVSIQKRPDDRPYAEFRFTDPDGNRLDLSQDKGWEVDLNKWERVA